jgi:WD40 repeat protein/predicted acylesterase/phospholipase RssA
MPAPPPLTPQHFQTLLSFCPDLRGLADDELARLAGLLQLAQYPRGRTLYGLRPGDAENRPLRIVVVGYLQEERPTEAQGRRSIGPLDVEGEDVVAAWAQARRGAAARWPPRPRSLHATDDVWVLELPHDDFEKAFPEGSPALARMERAHEVNDIAAEAVGVMERAPQLSNVRTDGLYHLLSGAEIVPPDGVLVHGGVVPPDYFLLLEGEFVFSHTFQDETVLQAPAIVGIDRLIAGRTADVDISARRTSRVLRLSGETFWQHFGIDADFHRAIVRSNEVSTAHTGGDDGEGVVVNLVLASASLRERRPDVDRVLGPLVDLVGERIATHTRDRVLVLHLLPKGSAGRDPWAKEYGSGFSGAFDDPPWLLHRWAPIDQGFAESVRAAIEAPLPDGPSGKLPGHVEVVLLDGSRLDQDTLVQGMVDLQARRKIVLVTDVPGELPPLAFMMRGFSTLHTGVLSLDPPTPGIGWSLSKGRAGMSEGMGLAGKLQAAGRGLAGVASTALENVAAMGKELVSTAKEEIAGAYAQAWPIGTVRVRFRRALLDRLAALPEGDGPVSFDGLALPGDGDEGGEAGAAGRTLDRWARAVTSRRVGLTLGGGGPYGVVHIPLLLRILEKNLPLDLMSGASVGSSVGAYFVVLGKEGLDLFLEHTLRVSLAAFASFVTSAVFEAVIAWDLGIVPLVDTEISFFPVVTDADTGIEWDVRHGHYALGVRASGSLPPLVGPTVIGDRRYLDGGLVANVPVNVLSDEGAALIVASNAISSVEPLERSSLRMPLSTPVRELANELNPKRRVEDAFRMIPMIFRTAGDAQALRADITFRPTARVVTMWSKFSKEDVDNGLKSPELAQVVTSLANHWRALQGHPESRVYLSRDEKSVVVWPIAFNADDSVGADSAPILNDLVEFLHRRVEGQRIRRLKVQVAAATSTAALRRAGAVVAFLVGAGVLSDRLEAAGVAAADEGVSYEILVWETDPAEAQRRIAEANARAEKAEKSSLARALTLAAAYHCVRGDLDLGRLLAIEAAALEPGPETDAVLRLALVRRGWTVRSLPAPRAAQQMAYRPDGHILAVGSGDGFVRLWDVAVETEGPPVPTPKPLAEIDHRTSSDPGIAGVTWSADGSLLATAGFDGTIGVHAVSGAGAIQEIDRFLAGGWEQWGVAFAPRGTRLLGTAEGTIRKIGLWDAVPSAPAEPKAVFEHDGKVIRTSWSPDGARIAVGTDAGKLYVWNAGEAPPAPGEIGASTAPIEDLAWSPTAPGRLALATGNQAVLRDADRGAAETISSGHTRPVRHVAWSADGKRLVTASDDGTARVWAEDGRFLMNLRDVDGPLEGAAWHPSGGEIATWTERGAAAVWDPGTGEQLAHLLGHQGRINLGAYCPDGRRLATGSTDGTVRIWDPLASRQIRSAGNQGAWHPSEPRLALAASDDGSAAVWDPATGLTVAPLLLADPAGPATIAWSRDGALAVASRPGLLRVWSAGRWDAPLHDLAEPADDTAKRALSFSPDGRYLAVKRADTVTVWDLSQSPPVARQLGSVAQATDLAWSPSAAGRFAVSCFRSQGFVLIFDLAHGDAPVLSIDVQDRPDGVWSIAYRPDGQVIAAGCNNGNAYLFAADDGRLLASVAHENAVKRVVWSADGGLLGTGDGGRTTAIFAVDGSFTVTRVSTRDGRGDAVEALAFDAGGTVLASGSAAGRCYLWRRAPGSPEAWTIASVLEGHSGRIRSLSLSPDGGRLLSAADDGAILVDLVDAGAVFDAVGAMPGRQALTRDEWAVYFGTSIPYRATWPRPRPDTAPRTTAAQRRA